MSTEVTGQIWPNAIGWEMQLREGKFSRGEHLKTVEFGQDGQLHLQQNERQLFATEEGALKEYESRIGQALLLNRSRMGVYEANYAIFNHKLPDWGRRGLMTAAMSELIVFVASQDRDFSSVFFLINPENTKSQALANKLGAKQSGHDNSYKLSVSDFMTRHEELA